MSMFPPGREVAAWPERGAGGGPWVRTYVHVSDVVINKRRWLVVPTGPAPGRGRDKKKQLIRRMRRIEHNQLN